MLEDIKARYKHYKYSHHYGDYIVVIKKIDYRDLNEEMKGRVIVSISSNPTEGLSKDNEIINEINDVFITTFEQVRFLVENTMRWYSMQLSKIPVNTFG